MRDAVGVSQYLGLETFLRLEVEGIVVLTSKADSEFPFFCRGVVGLLVAPERSYRFLMMLACLSHIMRTTRE